MALPGERKHHKFGPSKLNYIRACAGFKNRSGVTSDAAEQGTFLHSLMEGMLQQVIKGSYKLTLPQMSDWVVPNNELTEEEIDYLRFCCKRCDTFIAKGPSQIITEIDVHIFNTDGTAELNHGFLDVLFIFGDVGIIQDFKFGWEPVEAANKNLQGKAYALGIFQKHRQLNKIGVEFIQPKLNWTSQNIFHRLHIADMYQDLAEVIEKAEFVQDNPDKAQQFMAAGRYCKYCDLAPSCTILANYRAKAAARFSELPMPTSFKGLQLTDPADIALARYWCDIVETAAKEIKAKAFETAELNGGSISCTLPNGEVIYYEVKERNCDRSLGTAVEVSECLKEWISPTEVLAAAELSIGKLEAIAKAAYVELKKATGDKVTKKKAWEIISATLEAQGLLSRPDTKIRFLKEVKQVKQIQN